MPAMRLFLSAAAAGAAMFFISPACAQDVPSNRQLPSACRISAVQGGGACTPGGGPAYARQGGRLAHAIMFFGNSGAQIPERPNPAAAGEGGRSTFPQPARALPQEPAPAFTWPILTF